MYGSASFVEPNVPVQQNSGMSSVEGNNFEKSFFSNVSNKNKITSYLFV